MRPNHTLAQLKVYLIEYTILTQFDFAEKVAADSTFYRKQNSYENEGATMIMITNTPSSIPKSSYTIYSVRKTNCCGNHVH
jgi:hypothetical protein